MTEVNQTSEGQKPFILPSRVLNLLGGTLEEVNVGERKVTLVKEGAYLWGTPDLDLPKTQNVFDHSCRVGRGTWCLAIALRERSLALGDGLYSNLDPGIAAEAGVIHDTVKIHSGSSAPDTRLLGREDLTAVEKERIGLPSSYREISDDADKILMTWLKEGGFSEEVIKTVIGHDFPISYEAVKTQYQRLVEWADYACANKFMTTEQRLKDVFDRWIKPFVTNLDVLPENSLDMVVNHWQELVFSDKKPRIEPERAAKAAQVILTNRDELFGYLGMTEEEFIDEKKLNDDLKQSPWERVLRSSRKSDQRFQEGGGKGAPRSDRVKSVVERKIG